jgi:outer membrane lipoprotein-sorting protein
MSQTTARLTRALGAAVLALAFSGGSAGAQALPDARQVYARFIAATGGEAAIRSQKFRHVVAEMSMPLGTATMDLKYARPNRYAMKMEIPMFGTASSGYDGSVGWSMDPQGARVLSGAALEQVARGADMDSNLSALERFTDMRTMERATVDGRACYRVRMVSVTADTVFNCFDVESGFLTSVQAGSAAAGTATTVKMSDYREFGGVKMPSRTVTSAGGQTLTVTIRSVETGPIAASEFALPPEIRALVAAGGLEKKN